MISLRDSRVINRCAEKYNVDTILLFGSSSIRGRKAHDIDLAVRGLDPSRFFKFYGELLMGLSKPVDLVDLSQPTRFTRLIEKRSVILYERAR